MPDGSGIMTVGEIKDGKFSIDRVSGPTPGKYRVMVSSRPVFKINPGDSPGGGPRKAGRDDTVPSQYTGNSSPLVADVKADSPQTFEFSMSSKKP